MGLLILHNITVYSRLLPIATYLTSGNYETFREINFEIIVTGQNDLPYKSNALEFKFFCSSSLDAPNQNVNTVDNVSTFVRRAV